MALFPRKNVCVCISTVFVIILGTAYSQQLCSCCHERYRGWDDRVNVNKHPCTNDAKLYTKACNPSDICINYVRAVNCKVKITRGCAVIDRCLFTMKETDGKYCKNGIVENNSTCTFCCYGRNNCNEKWLYTEVVGVEKCDLHWKPWSACSATCDTGQQRRVLYCKYCNGTWFQRHETRNCSNFPCVTTTTTTATTTATTTSTTATTATTKATLITTRATTNAQITSATMSTTTSITTTPLTTATKASRPITKTPMHTTTTTVPATTTTKSPITITTTTTEPSTSTTTPTTATTKVTTTTNMLTTITPTAATTTQTIKPTTISTSLRTTASTPETTTISPTSTTTTPIPTTTSIKITTTSPTSTTPKMTSTPMATTTRGFYCYEWDGKGNDQKLVECAHGETFCEIHFDPKEVSIVTKKRCATRKICQNNMCGEALKFALCCTEAGCNKENQPPFHTLFFGDSC